MTRSLLQMLVELPPALDVLLKASLILGLGWVLHFALGRSNPRWRVLLWRAVAVGLLSVPLLGAVMPALKLTVPHRPVAAAFGPNYGNQALNESETASVLTSPQALMIARPQQAPRKNVFINIMLHPGLSLSIVWASVSMLLAFKLLFSLRGVKRILLSAGLVGEAIQETLDDLRENLGITRTVELRASDELSSPFLSGFRRPVIILPERMTHGDYVKELPAIFVHELAHLKGRDLAWMTLIHLLSIAFWFHPLTWRMRAAHAAACESVSDAVAATHVGNALTYSRTLARIALELVALPPAVGGIAMARMPEVRRRLEALKGKIVDRPLARHWVTVTTVLGLTALSMIAGIRFVSAETASIPESATRSTQHTESLPEVEDDQSITLQLHQGKQRHWQGLSLRLLRVRLPAPADRPPDPSQGTAEFTIVTGGQSQQRSMQAFTSEFIGDYRITLESITPDPDGSGADTACFSIVNVAWAVRNQQAAAQGQSKAPARESEMVLQLQQGEKKKWRDFTLRLIRVGDSPNLRLLRLPNSNLRAAEFIIDTLLQSESRSMLEGTSMTLGQYRFTLEKVSAQRGNRGAGSARFRITDLAPRPAASLSRSASPTTSTRPSF